MSVLSHQSTEFPTIRGAKDERLAGVFSLDFGDDPGFGPGKTAVFGDRLQDFERGPIATVGPLVVEPEVAAILQWHDAAESHHAGEPERRHFLPSLTTVLTHDGRHARPAARPEGRRKNPEPFFSMGAGDPINARAIEVLGVTRRQGVIEPSPRLATIYAFGHRAGCPTVVDAPDAKDRFAVGHGNRGRVPLVDLGGSLRDDRMTITLAREIHQRKVREFFRVEGRESNEKGDEERSYLHGVEVSAG